METHPNNIVNAMRLVGYLLADMLPAYPGKDEPYLDQLLRDSAQALSRPVIPYGLLGIHPCRSRYFNVSEHGFRTNGEAQAWPPDSGTTNIFFFGGSTTAGFNVEDRQTIPAVLRRKLGEAGVNCEVYNFGSGNYTSRHAALRFLDLIDQRRVPQWALFLDGYNDCYYAFGNLELVSVLDTLYQREKRRRRTTHLQALLEFAVTSYADRRKPLPSAYGYDPRPESTTVQEVLSESGIRHALESSSQQLSPSEITHLHKEIGELVWGRYLDSVAMIRALAQRNGVKTLFVWQPVPFYKTRAQKRVMEQLYFVYRYGVLSSLVYNWLDSAEFPGMAKEADFMDLSGLGEGTEGVSFVDMAHYSASFCEAIADRLATALILRLR